jgi:hypothetical protein
MRLHLFPASPEKNGLSSANAGLAPYNRSRTSSGTGMVGFKLCVSRNSARMLQNSGEFISVTAVIPYLVPVQCCNRAGPSMITKAQQATISFSRKDQAIAMI